MPDPIPPPEQPMDQATRARIRARLDAGTGGDQAPRPHRWLAPVGAAAAVLLIAATAGYAVFRQDPTGTPAPAGASSAVPTVAPPETGLPLPTGASLLTDGPRSTDGSCAETVPRRLQGAQQVASLRLSDGEAGVWVAGDRSVVCEDSGGIVTLHRTRSVAPPETLDRDALGFSSSTYSYPPNPLLTAYVAGGSLPDGVIDIGYAFPGGRVEEAVISRDDAGRRWWLMGLVPSDGPLADPGTNVLRLDPVRVVVQDPGGRREVALRWGHDDCAQVNHGC